MFTLAFLKGAAERAISTFAQALVSVLGIAGLGLLDVDWGQTLSVAGLAALLSVLKSVATPGFTAGAPEPQGRHEAGVVPPELDGYPIPGPHPATEADPERYRGE